MIALWAMLALGAPQDPPPRVADLVVQTVEQCVRGDREPVTADSPAPEAQDARNVTVRIGQRGCSLDAEDWTADDGELVGRVWTVLRDAPNWSMVELRLPRANERGPSQWSRFMQKGADGNEIAWVFIIEPAAGTRDSFSLLYQRVEP